MDTVFTVGPWTRVISTPDKPQAPKNKELGLNQQCIHWTVHGTCERPIRTTNQTDCVEPDWQTPLGVHPERNEHSHDRGQPKTPNDVSGCSSRMPHVVNSVDSCIRVKKGNLEHYIPQPINSPQNVQKLQDTTFSEEWNFLNPLQLLR